MNQRALRTILNFTALIMLTFAYLCGFQQSELRLGESVVDSSVSPLVGRTGIDNPQSATAHALRSGTRVLYGRGHCPSGCHAGVQPGYLHTH